MKKKMINLKSLQETLNANELKNILGGSSGAFSCYCHGIPEGGNGATIAWAFTPLTTMEILERIESECGDFGGTCNAIEDDED